MKPTSSICRHFGDCGGCQFQDIPYRVQLQRKEERCRVLRDEAGVATDVRPIIPSPQIFYYRNKMEFTFGAEEGGVICGLHRRGRKRSILPVKECLISFPETGVILEAITTLARQSGRPAYDPYRHQGFWRNLVIREGKFTGDLLINLVTSSSGELDQAGLFSALNRVLPEGRITSLIHTVNDSISNAVIPEQWEVLQGNPFLEERIAGLTFQIPPFSFFQVNPAMMEIFYRELKEILRLRGRERILDLFSGCGAIGLVLSRPADSILGIEIEPEAVQTAYLNARRNGIGNLSFRSGKVARVLAENRGDWPGRFDLVIVNPPRSGISSKIARRLLELEADRIVYSSCNPETFFPQVGLLESRYRPVVLQPFDFFPHTPHLEMLAIFEKKG